MNLTSSKNSDQNSTKISQTTGILQFAKSAVDITERFITNSILRHVVEIVNKFQPNR